MHSWWPSVPRTLLHCGADKLADQRQELLRVPGMELLQQGEQSEDKRWPIHGVGRFPADHSCKDDRWRWHRQVRCRLWHRQCECSRWHPDGGHVITGGWPRGGNDDSALPCELGPGLTEASSAWRAQHSKTVTNFYNYHHCFFWIIQLSHATVEKFKAIDKVNEKIKITHNRLLLMTTWHIRFPKQLSQMKTNAGQNIFKSIFKHHVENYVRKGSAEVKTVEEGNLWVPKLDFWGFLPKERPWSSAYGCMGNRRQSWGASGGNRML